LEQLYKSFGSIFRKADPGEDEPQRDGFTDNYGWIYTAHQVRESHGVGINEVYDMPCMEFLNEVVYLKEYGDHIKKITNARNTEF